MYVSRFWFSFLLAFDTASAELSLTGRVRTAAGVTDAEKGGILYRLTWLTI